MISNWLVCLLRVYNSSAKTPNAREMFDKSFVPHFTRHPHSHQLPTLPKHFINDSISDTDKKNDFGRWAFISVPWFVPLIVHSTAQTERERERAEWWKTTTNNVKWCKWKHHSHRSILHPTSPYTDYSVDICRQWHGWHVLKLFIWTIPIVSVSVNVNFSICVLCFFPS